MVNALSTKLEAWVHRDGKMYLMHAFVPYDLRGQGVGKELVLKTFKRLKKEGYEAIAVCSYIRAIAERETEWKHQIG